MLTQNRLNELLSYDKETGIFIWIMDRGNGTKDGDIAGVLDDGYIRIKIDGRMYRAHLLAHLYINGEFPGGEVDHKDHVRNNNKWENIKKAVTQKDNMKNLKLRYNNTTGACGVYWVESRRKWRVRIEANNKRLSLGSFTTYFAAVYARHAANIKYGYHTNHGK